MSKIILAFVTMVLMSCNFHDQRKNDATEALTKANQSLMANHSDTLAVKDAQEAVRAFINRFPEDTISPFLLFELALVYEKQRQYDSTIKTLDKIYSFYPHSKQAGKAVFLEGFLYANVLNKLDKAKEMYQLYLEKYSSSDSKMTNDVKMEIQNLGKSPDQILKEIQEKARMDSAQAS